MKSLTKYEVNYNGTQFLMDVADGNLMSLNEIYVAAGSPASVSYTHLDVYKRQMSV